MPLLAPNYCLRFFTRTIAAARCALAEAQVRSASKEKAILGVRGCIVDGITTFLEFNPTPLRPQTQGIVNYKYAAYEELAYNDSGWLENG